MNSPEGRSAFDCATAAEMSSAVTPRDWAAARSTMTLICRCVPPFGAALATP